MQFDKLGPYRLSKKLGQGGMGSVYQGLDESTGQSAAIKVLSPHLALEEGFRVRFEAEIESLKKLRHPNIVRLYGYGEQAGYVFYAMELVEGTSLEEELRAGRRFQWREVTQLSIKLCRALKHAHDHGIIHRDIKPANLLLSTTGEIRLSDFGIARLFGNTRLTNDGGVLGTAEYMAPEQADGRPVTDRCDQYSLGGVMYALLAGRPPFRAATLVEMLQLQRFAEPQPVRRYAPEIPMELDRIISQLLEKEPQKRFVNTLMLARALEAMERGLSLSSQRGDFLLPADTDAPHPIDAIGPTLVPAATAKPVHPDSTAPGLEGPASVLSVEPAVRAVGPMDLEGDAAGGVFTKVEDTVSDRPIWRDELRAALTSWQTIAAAGGLLAIALFAWQLLRAPSADRLFADIEAAAARGEPAALKEAEPKIQEFLERFPDDERREHVQAWADRAHELRSERQLDNKARSLTRGGARSPVERAYRDALGLKNNNPELAIDKFQALVDLYGHDAAEHDENEWVRLARTELNRLEKQLAFDVQADRRALDEQLAEADRLDATDDAAAAKIRRAIVVLYADKPWAADQVDRSRRQLAKNGPAAATGPPSDEPAQAARP